MNPGLRPIVSAGDDVEGNVAAALYDLCDSQDDNLDRISLGFKPIWDVLVQGANPNARQENFRDFWDAFKTTYRDNAERVHLAKAALFQNTVDYNDPPAITITPITGHHAAPLIISATPDDPEPEDDPYLWVEFQYSLDGENWHPIGRDYVPPYQHGFALDENHPHVRVRAMAWDYMENSGWDLTAPFGIGQPAEVLLPYVAVGEGDQHSPALAYGDNRFFVAWNDRDALVRAKIYDLDGNVLKEEFTIATSPRIGNILVTFSDNKFFVAWKTSEDRPYPLSSEWHIRGALYDSSGNRVGSDFDLENKELSPPIYIIPKNLGPFRLNTSGGLAGWVVGDKFLVVWSSGHNVYGTTKPFSRDVQVSEVNPIERWQNTMLFTLPVTVFDYYWDMFAMEGVQLWYRYSRGVFWDDWRPLTTTRWEKVQDFEWVEVPRKEGEPPRYEKVPVGPPRWEMVESNVVDMTPPWEFDLPVLRNVGHPYLDAYYYPTDEGYYEFASVFVDNEGGSEVIPTTADTSIAYANGAGIVAEPAIKYVSPDNGWWVKPQPIIVAWDGGPEFAFALDNYLNSLLIPSTLEGDTGGIQFELVDLEHERIEFEVHAYDAVTGEPLRAEVSITGSGSASGYTPGFEAEFGIVLDEITGRISANYRIRISKFGYYTETITFYAHQIGEDAYVFWYGGGEDFRVEVMGPLYGVWTELEPIEPGLQEEMQWAMHAIKLDVPSDYEGYLNLHLRAVDPAGRGSKPVHLGPFMFTRLVELGEDYSDAILTGAPRYLGLDIPGGTPELLLQLGWAGSDLDLHLYDPERRHVGWNYETNELDLEIPETKYSGRDAKPEWIRVPNPQQGFWVVMVYPYEVEEVIQYTFETFETFADVSPPESSIEPILPYWKESAPFEVSATASDPALVSGEVPSGVKSVELWCRYSTDNLTWGDWMPYGAEDSAPYSWAFDAPAGGGFYEFYSVATDRAGNREEAPDAVDARAGVDTTPPDSSVNPISPYWQKSTPFAVSATATDALSGVASVKLFYRYSPDNSAWGSWASYNVDDASPWSWQFTALEGDGYYEFYSIAVDRAGNREEAPESADARATIDVTPPISSVDSISPYWHNMETVPFTVTATASDSFSGVRDVALWYRFSPDNATWSNWAVLGTDDEAPWSWEFTAPEGDGYYEFCSVATDKAGNAELLEPVFTDEFAGTSLDAATWSTGKVKVKYDNIAVSDGRLQLTSRATTAGTYGAIYAVSNSPFDFSRGLVFDVPMSVPTDDAPGDFRIEFYLTPAFTTTANPHDQPNWLRVSASVDREGVRWMLQRRRGGGGVGTLGENEEFFDNVELAGEPHMYTSGPTARLNGTWRIAIDNKNITVWLDGELVEPTRPHGMNFTNAYLYLCERTKVAPVYTVTFNYLKIQKFAADAWAGVDTSPPTSSVNPVEPYWQESVPFAVSATASDMLSGVASVEIYYRSSTDNANWGEWRLFGVDNHAPYEWLFDAPDGYALYEFYSVATDVALNVERALEIADASCGVVIPATIDIDSDTLNLKSQGKWITAYIEFPSGYDLASINVGTITLEGAVPAELHPTEIGDHDGDGVPDFMVKFDRSAVQALLEPGEAELTVIGKWHAVLFKGSDTIRVIEPGEGSGQAQENGQGPPQTPPGQGGQPPGQSNNQGNGNQGNRNEQGNQGNRGQGQSNSNNQGNGEQGQGNGQGNNNGNQGKAKGK